MSTPARYTSIKAPEGDCQGCEKVQTQRSFCGACRAVLNLSCTWCLGRGWKVEQGAWVACQHP